MSPLARRQLVLVLVALLSTRVALSLWLPTLPDVEPLYIHEALSLYGGAAPIEDVHGLAYPWLLITAHRLVDSWPAASHLLLIVSSTMTPVMIAWLAGVLVGQRAAWWALGLAAILPNLTVATAGYSHIVPVALAFFAASLVPWWRLSHRPSWRCSLAVAVLGLCAALVRSEYAAHFFILAGWYVAGTTRGSGPLGVRRLRYLALAVLVFLFGMLAHSVLCARLTRSQGCGLLGEARYAYTTYMHTLSLRRLGFIDQGVANRASLEAFGEGKELGYSIAAAVARNPREAAQNLLFNLRSLLRDAAHPLFLPFFLYLPMGYGLFAFGRGREPGADAFLIVSTVVPTVIFVLLFHVEVRYLSPITIPALIWTAHGLSGLEGRTRKTTAVVIIVGLAAILAAYGLHFRAERVGPGPTADGTSSR